MFEWKDDERLYSAGAKNLYLGKWCVASVGWDGVNKIDEKWIIYLHLPGLKVKMPTQYKEIEDAQAKAEKYVLYWIKEAKIGENEK